MEKQNLNIEQLYKRILTCLDIADAILASPKSVEQNEVPFLKNDIKEYRAEVLAIYESGKINHLKQLEKEILTF